MNIITTDNLSSTKDQFIKNIINELNNENKNRINNNKEIIDVCYIISVVDQQIEKCKEFIDDITTHTYLIENYDEEYSEGYTNGRIKILIKKPDNENGYTINTYYNYFYYMEFLYDERPLGYCECESENEGYNEKYSCCGENCNWESPAFRIEKITDLGYHTWIGQEKDYWKYKDKYELDNKNEEIEEFKLEQKKQELKDRINKLQDEYNKLEYGNLTLVI